ncbi:unnamed protein product [Microthlaspi erraticum]|uniref:KIB1-4 beta-propeller domain-containing protein n=1 Tax=Microthlaspi erraticum TaxID=1685480 RepID=A0A6D2KBU5_9BRAS|nr:unnamed protein product [Microthlaspi erraticum]
MSLLLSRLSKPALVSRRAYLSLGLLSNFFSSSSVQKQTPPCNILAAHPSKGKLYIFNAPDDDCTTLDKKVPSEVVNCDPMVKIGASHGWVAHLMDDGIWRLQDDVNPYASSTHPKRIPLPLLVTLPHCQTQIVTNVAMSSSSPEDQDCVVAVKFLGPQLSFCRPAAQSNPEWTNVRIQNPCFSSSRVMFSKKDNMFRIPSSGGHLIGSWDLNLDHPNPNFQTLRFRDLPKLTNTKRELMHSCSTSNHLVESESTFHRRNFLG